MQVLCAQDTTFMKDALPYMITWNFPQDSLIRKNNIRKKIVQNFIDSAGKRHITSSYYFKYDREGRIVELNPLDCTGIGCYPCIIKFKWLKDRRRVKAMVYYSSEAQERKLEPQFSSLNGELENYVHMGDTSLKGNFRIEYDIDLFENGAVRRIRHFDYRLKEYKSRYTSYFVENNKCDTVFYTNGDVKEIHCKTSQIFYENKAETDSFYSDITQYFDTLKRVHLVSSESKSTGEKCMTKIRYLRRTNKMLSSVTECGGDLYNIFHYYYDNLDCLMRMTYQKNGRTKYIDNDYWYAKNNIRFYEKSMGSTDQRGVRLLNRYSVFEGGLIRYRWYSQDKSDGTIFTYLK